MAEIKLKANAKLNLFLNILNKRKDGYHNIKTIFQEVSLSDEIESVKTWRKLQKVNVFEFDGFPNIRCPLCGTIMAKMFHTMLTAVVVDRCFNKGCRAIWCDGRELEKIQILVEEAEKDRE